MFLAPQRSKERTTREAQEPRFIRSHYFEEESLPPVSEEVRSFCPFKFVADLRDYLGPPRGDTKEARGRLSTIRLDVVQIKCITDWNTVHPWHTAYIHINNTN